MMLEAFFKPKLRIATGLDGLKISVVIPFFALGFAAAVAGLFIFAKAVSLHQISPNQGILIVIFAFIFIISMAGPTRQLILSRTRPKVANLNGLFKKTRVVELSAIESYYTFKSPRKNGDGKATGDHYFVPILSLNSGQQLLVCERTNYTKADAAEIIKNIDLYAPSAENLGIVDPDIEPDCSLTTLGQNICARVTASFIERYFRNLYRFLTAFALLFVLPYVAERCLTHDAQIVSSAPWCFYNFQSNGKLVEVLDGDCLTGPKTGFLSDGRFVEVIEGRKLSLSFETPTAGKVNESLNLVDWRAKQVIAEGHLAVVYNRKRSPPVSLPHDGIDTIGVLLGIAMVVGIVWWSRRSMKTKVAHKIDGSISVKPANF